jgi:hypothetical protein
MMYAVKKSDDARRAKLLAVICEFRGEPEGETTVKLAAEILELRRQMLVIKQVADGKVAGVIPNGPHGAANAKARRDRDIADGFYKSFSCEQPQPMNALEARSLVKWMLAFSRNATLDREFTTRGIALAVEHYQAGIDPWESSAAICEGRDLLIPKKSKAKR